MIKRSIVVSHLLPVTEKFKSLISECKGSLRKEIFCWDECFHVGLLINDALILVKLMYYESHHMTENLKEMEFCHFFHSHGSMRNILHLSDQYLFVSLQDYMMQQTMLRVKNPATSLDFYTRVLGMTSVISHSFLFFRHFCVIFLGSNHLQIIGIVWEQLIASVFQLVAEDRFPVHAIHPVLPGLRGKIRHPSWHQRKDGVDIFPPSNVGADAVRTSMEKPDGCDSLRWWSMLWFLCPTATGALSWIKACRTTMATNNRWASVRRWPQL